jgi:hypothetical protein
MEEYINTVIKNPKFDDFGELKKVIDDKYTECDGVCRRTCKEIVDDGEKLYCSIKRIYCTKCYENKCYEEILKNLEYIDRRNFSIKEKPHNHFCDICNKSVGGGCEWYCNIDTDVDICMNCYNKDFSKDIILVDENVYICNRTSNFVLLKIEEVKDLKIPNQLVDQIKKENINEWIEMFNSMANISLNGKIVNLCEWLPFTDLYNIPNGHAISQLLVNCGNENNGQIASLVIDDHGRISIDLIYDNVDQYCEDYNKWKDSRASNKDDQDDDQDDEKDLEYYERQCTEFCGYIRINKRLRIYYG